MGRKIFLDLIYRSMQDYVKHILKDCKDHSDSIINYWTNE